MRNKWKLVLGFCVMTAGVFGIASTEEISHKRTYIGPDDTGVVKKDVVVDKELTGEKVSITVDAYGKEDAALNLSESYDMRDKVTEEISSAPTYSDNKQIISDRAIPLGGDYGTEMPAPIHPDGTLIISDRAIPLGSDYN